MLYKIRSKNHDEGTALAEQTVFLKFAMYVYLPWWITATVPATAPCHDLNLINSILQFKERNQGAAEGALMCIQNHL